MLRKIQNYSKAVLSQARLGKQILPSSAQLANQSRQLGWLVLLPQSPLPDRQAGRPEKYFLAKIELGHQIQSCFPQ